MHRRRRARAGRAPAGAGRPHGQRLSLDPPGEPTLGQCLLDDLSGPLAAPLRNRSRPGARGDRGPRRRHPRQLRRQGRQERRRLRPGEALLRLRGRLGTVERLALRLHPLPAAARTVAVGDERWQELHHSQLVPSAVDIAGEEMHVLFEGSQRPWTPRRGRWAARRPIAGTSCGRSRRRSGAAGAGTARPHRSCGPAHASRTSPRPPTAVEHARRAGRGGAVDPELIADCVHCGFCLPTCPTYALWHEEMDSPRGRIHLMAGLRRLDRADRHQSSSISIAVSAAWRA